MATELKTIGPAELPAVIDILNKSSAGLSFQYDLNLVSYLNLSRFWNISYESSYLACADSQPAGVLLNCLDRPSGEAYSFYWGVLPEYRKGRLSMELVRTYLAEMKRQGLRRMHATSGTDSPLNIYIKLGYREQHRLIELRASAIPVGPCDGITKLDVPALLSELPSFARTICPWVSRPASLQSAAPFLEILGIRNGERLDAWMALTRWTGETTIVALDSRPDAEDAAERLVLHLSTYPPPFAASHIVSGSRADVLLRRLGFAAALERVSIALDLDTYSPKR